MNKRQRKKIAKQKLYKSLSKYDLEFSITPLNKSLLSSKEYRQKVTLIKSVPQDNKQRKELERICHSHTAELKKILEGLERNSRRQVKMKPPAPSPEDVDFYVVRGRRVRKIKFD